MAKKKDVDPANPETWDKNPQIITSHPEDIELDEVFSGLPETEACIELFRINAQGGRPLFLEAVQPVAFSLAYVLGRYGGGRYVAHAKYKTGDRVKHQFEIEGEPLPVRRLGPGNGVEPIAIAQPAPQARAWMTETTAPAEFEPVPSDMTGMFSVLVQLIKDMKSSKADMLKEMMMYKELFGAPQQTGPQTTVDQVMSMISKGVELAGRAGAGGEQSIWIELARELKEPIGKGLDALQMALASKQPPQRPAMAVPPMGQIAQPSPQEPPQQEGGGMNTQILMQLRSVLPMLINAATKNAEPEMYSDLILDQVPESLYPTLRDWLIRPDCLDLLAQLEPGIRYQQEWWVSLRSVLIDALTGELGHGLTSVQPPENPKPPTGGPTPSGPAA